MRTTNNFLVHHQNDKIYLDITHKIDLYFVPLTLKQKYFFTPYCFVECDIFISPKQNNTYSMLILLNKTIVEVGGHPMGKVKKDFLDILCTLLTPKELKMFPVINFLYNNKKSKVEIHKPFNYFES